ncbi:MAG TPA: toll/interleukin-1 receptor domain-containing protein [Pyrinomonadaceae bacterium]|nr:toll/interleukin-1 receptor domain-containing protein [Pyrinomonadaceae bacterium]
MIFLSYSFKDRERLLPLLKVLEAKGVELWFDQTKVGLGDSLIRKMSEGLAESDLLLVAWSQNAAVSDHVLNELDAFYWRRPQPPFILFIRMDDTPVPAIYAARKYLRLTDDVNQAAQTIINWVNGQPDPQIHDAGATAPSPQFLHRFPRGPRVPFILITDELVYAYAEALGTSAQARRIINKANQMREEADPGDSTVTLLNFAFLPTFEAVGAYAYWQEVFHAACLNGPRMLGALLLSQPDDQFDLKARRDRAKLLEHLNAMRQRSGEA